VKRYIRKLGVATEKLQTQYIIQQHELAKIRSIVEKRRTQKTGKRVGLKGEHLFTTPARLQFIQECESATQQKSQQRKRRRQSSLAETQITTLLESSEEDNDLGTLLSGSDNEASLLYSENDENDN
jgi:hypothetical protein